MIQSIIKIVDQQVQNIKINVMQGFAPFTSARSTSDQIAQRTQVFDLLKYTDPNLLCGSKNKITLICISKQCKAPSLHCQNQQCTFCQPHLENNCTNFQLRALTSLMKKKCQNVKYNMQQLLKIENQILKIFEKKRIELFQAIKYNNLTKQEVFIVQNIFEKQSIQSKLRGCQISGLIQKLKSNKQTFKIDCQTLIIKKKMKNIEYLILELYSKAINEIKNPTKNYAKVDTKIMEQDPVGLGFILQQLNHPTQLKLLYRASQHRFSSQQFQKKCFRVQNTLTIIRTIENKVIACFLPCQWALSIYGTYTHDTRLNRREIFILSVTLRQKFKGKTYFPPQPSDLYGPIFGRDFYLLNGDPENLAQLFMDFHLKLDLNDAQEKSSQTMQKIVGKDVDKFIRVNEYEVYQVIQQKKKPKLF